MIRLLAVDDLPENLRLLRKALAETEFDVQLAACGKDALASAASAMPDLILLDLRLGEEEMTGFELARRLRALPGGRRAVIVALSGGAVLEDEAASREAGLDGFIAKPFDVAALPEVLRVYAGRRAGPAAQ